MISTFDIQRTLNIYDKVFQNRANLGHFNVMQIISVLGVLHYHRKRTKIYTFDSDLVWRMQLKIING